MTDQGALERAQSLARSWYYMQSSRKWELSGPVENTAVTARVMAHFFDDVANLIVATASEARTVTIEECIEAILKMCREYSGVLPSQDGFLESLSRCVVPVLRALATPAQSEGK